MKISIDIDLTPEEARRLYGLPDITEFNKNLADKIQEAIKDGDGSTLGQMLTPILNNSMQSMENYQKMMWSLFNNSSSNSSDDKK